ncbi:S66 peptidase family protein [Mucisphaera sp.]|uniref:S66 peptidase family protein n=1 Tax=Mucisphaera sp. TaxID=2913024 RepID=UPI003D12DC99
MLSFSLRSAFTVLLTATVLLNGCSTAFNSTADRSHAPVRPLIKPKALEPGDTIAFVAPAGELDQERIERAQVRLADMGFKIVIPPNLYRKHGYLAGSDHERAAELMAVFQDPEIDAIFPGTGGYGATRILELLDYEVIRANPKVFIGFSDITALHAAFHQRAGLVTFHSPNPMWGLGSESNLRPFSADYFWRALLKSSYEAEDAEPYVIKSDERVEVPVETMVGGIARGQIVGGNLSLVQAVTGTPYQYDTVDKILYLEDIGEAPYRVDRMLRQMKDSGQLDQISGAILGRFTRRAREDTSNETTTMREVLEDYFLNLGVPIIKNFPAGHVADNATLPFGVLVEMDADAQTITVLERPVVLE